MHWMENSTRNVVPALCRPTSTSRLFAFPIVLYCQHYDSRIPLVVCSIAARLGRGGGEER